MVHWGGDPIPLGAWAVFRFFAGFGGRIHGGELEFVSFLGRIVFICAVVLGVAPGLVLAGVESGAGEGVLGCRKCWSFLVIAVWLPWMLG